MIEIDEQYIPLILEHNETIITYIIDNQVLGTKSYVGVSTYPYRAYHLLLELAANEHVRKALPKELLSSLDLRTEVPAFFSKDYLIGEMSNNYGSRCLTLDITIDESVSQSIQLTNIQYLHGTSKMILPAEPRLTPIYAFLLFANILANNRSTLYRHLLKEFHLADFEQLKVQEDIVDFERGRLQSIGPIYSDLNEFSFQYLKFLKRNLLNESISPKEILYTSGAKTLAFLGSLPVVTAYLEEIKQKLRTQQLPYNQQVLYHTFRSSFIREFDENWKKHHEENAFFLSLFERDVAKEFPELNK
ncbi:MAG: hypothetical protein KGD59_05655 [Candidatus Heimdallarchaeota archaeon]|nr:hypothetical protein [Candidatus Heimdallarchaeota archaeon]MBY8994017.1 hypothetical protein [Candidatus Heimdallarchaeota archaeon]